VSAFCTPRSKWLNSLSFLCCSVDTKQVLKLYSLWCMEKDIEAAMAEEARMEVEQK